MAWSDVGMELSVGPLIGLVFAGLIALLFVVSCVVSAVKAVRDRQHIKARIRARRSQKANDGNGHAHGVGNSPEHGRKGRPNILIIHDGAREERVKKGTSFNSMESSPRYPSGVSSPGEQNSRYTETTTLAEVACHQSSLGSTPAADFGDSGAKAEDIEAVTNGRCLLPGQISDRDDNDHGVAYNPVDITGEAVMYKKSSSSSSTSPSHLNREGGNVVTTFPVVGSPEGCIEDPASRSKRRYGVNSRMNHRDIEEREGAPASSRYAVSEGNIFHTRDSRGASSTHGFTKKASSHLSPTHAPEHEYSRYNPRRNSYAAAIANPDWIEVAPVRRHSDEARHLVGSASERHQDNVRLCSYGNIGADNPAFDAADDRTEL